MIAISILALGDPRPQSRDRLQGRHPDRLRDARPDVARARSATRRREGRPGERVRSRAAGPSTSGDSYKSFQISTETLTTDEAAQLQSDLTKTVKADAFGIKNVSSSFGRQIAKSAILAIIVSLLLIVGYISIRFQWQFAVPAIVALIHDIVITIGIYALLGREVTTATVAAVLTVLGYSIYDTIIIFDRIRENIPLMKRGSFRQITNVSLWETIPRSLATTFITLLPIASLLIFGGATLNDFAFALFIGIASGAYSSIFVAAPLLDWLKEREPEFARRKHEEALRGAVGRRRARRRDAHARRGGRGTPGSRSRAGRRRPGATGKLGRARSSSRPPLEPPARPRPLTPTPRPEGVHFGPWRRTAPPSLAHSSRCCSRGSAGCR